MTALNYADQTIGFSIETFNHHFQMKGLEGLGVLDNRRSAGTLIDIRTEGIEPGEVRNGNQGAGIEVLCARVTKRLFSKLENQVHGHPKLLQFEELAEKVLKHGWDRDSEAFLETEIARARCAQERLDQMYLADGEWTEETAVADVLLEEGTALYLDALISLRDALDRSEDAVEESLAWLGEGFFYLMAVQEWKIECE